MRSAHAAVMFPELCETAYELCTREALRAHYPFLFCQPENAKIHREWAAKEIGEDNRLEPSALLQTLGLTAR
jgi:hypothetical protein